MRSGVSRYVSWEAAVSQEAVFVGNGWVSFIVSWIKLIFYLIILNIFMASNTEY